MRTITTARCLHEGCAWRMPPPDVAMTAARIDAAAEKHTKTTGHPTSTSTRPAEGESDEHV